ncbi:Queuine tRNA-ribosyltransferase [Aquicella siphonis]|uniref:Queuine tRNA-ribosyltransferase n=1 Tax=Aquicella siphonis TaxID=254247 RepID=A0A5E4PE93_9COXI|nr:tRNA guanosine(34) transglycosylase Tgt [Aquicella siphonis]VVC74747.1 Queuine tRNA-ribosyltransferase [Aquicella siphonis]
MSNIFHSEVVKKHASLPARVMRMVTPHGEVLTPAFMPVGTRAMLNYLTPADLDLTGSEIILGGNTYHMLCTPGMETIEAVGGMHQFMGWHKAMLTDSGGFQVLSLSKKGTICIIDDHGAHFKHPITGKILHLNSQTSIQAQKIIGADIIMAFDQCTPETGGREAALAALDRTHRWLVLSKEEQLKNPHSAYGFRQALFGIIQGGSFRDLREQSTEFVLSQELDGLAIGGEVIGFDMPKTCEIIDWVRPMLPDDKVRYTMGVGLHPQDLIDVVAKGIDIFDCVAPTRNARHGTLYCGSIVERDGWLSFEGENGQSRILIKKSQYARDTSPVMPGCDCYTCGHFSRAYLHYLFKEGLIAYFHLSSIHNIHVMQKVCRRMRDLILAS